MASVKMLDNDRIAVSFTKEKFTIPRSGQKVIYQKKVYRVIQVDSYFNEKLTYVLTVKAA